MDPSWFPVVDGSLCKVVADRSALVKEEEMFGTGRKNVEGNCRRESEHCKREERKARGAEIA